MSGSTSKTIQTLDPPELSTPPTYSHVSAVEGPAKLIFTAGQVGADKDGKVPESYEDQIKQALSNLTACLKAFGASRLDIVKVSNATPGFRYRFDACIFTDFWFS